MFNNNFKIAWRNLWKNKTFTLLNLGSLSISLAACLIIYFWIANELNFDSGGANADRVYRVGLTLRAKGQPDKLFAVTATPLAPVLVKDFPEIEKAVRLTPFTALIGYKNEHFFTNRFLFADSSFFDVFGFQMLKGDPHSALNGTHSVVITESLAKKYFNNEDPIGKTITCNDTLLLIVTGVSKDIPETSHFHFDMICSFQTMFGAGIGSADAWWEDDYYTYILLKKHVNPSALGARLTNIMDKYNGAQNKAIGFTGLHFLQPLKSIHLHSDLRGELSPNGNMSTLRIFEAIAIFLLLVACINYINLTTATSFKRAKEIGIRKVAGAALWQLIAQFLSESILITLAGIILAFGMAQLTIPLFNTIASTNVSIELTWRMAAAMLICAVLLGVIAGIYPAFYLSRVRPIKVFKSGEGNKQQLLSLRKGLVIFQFTIAVVLIVATIIALQQLYFMRTQDTGFDKEQVVAIPFRNQEESNDQDLLKREFGKIAGVTMASVSSSTPGKGLSNIVVLPEGVSEDRVQTMNTLVVDFDFINTYKLGVVAGRSFSRDYRSDSSAFMINETAVRELGWGNPGNAIGKSFNWGLGSKGKIIGVVKDFHFNSLQHKIPALVMLIQPVPSGWYRYLSVRVSTGDIQKTIHSMEAGWKRFLPQHPFEYFFVDEDYDKQFKSEQRLGNLSAIFSGLTIFISCMGLLGLAMVSVSRRTREIGVRKVLGATVSGITVLLSKEFLKLVAVAVVLATPIAWWLMNKWLGDFAYRIKISPWVFCAAGLIAMTIALVTVSFQAVKAAISNPVKALRTE